MRNARAGSRVSGAIAPRTKRTTKEIERILLRVKEKLKKVYGKRLLRIVLYGSFARNNATQESDIDIAVVLEGYVDKGKEIDRVGDTLYDLMIGAGELISVYPVSEEELENSRWPLYRHIRDEGISIWTR